MSHLPDYFEHLVRERGLSQGEAAERLSVLQNAFPFAKKDDEEEETMMEPEEDEMPMKGKKKKKKGKQPPAKPAMEY